MLPKAFTLLLLLICSVAKSESQIKEVVIKQDQEMILLNVSAEIVFPKAVTEAIHSGLPLEFNYQFEIKEKKWYKVQPLAKINKIFYLSYRRITNQYLVTNPVTLEQTNFSTLYETKQFMENIQAFPLIPRSKIPSGEVTLGVRFHLTNNNLPSYVSVERVFSDDWSVDSDWSYWPLP